MPQFESRYLNAARAKRRPWEKLCSGVLIVTAGLFAAASVSLLFEGDAGAGLLGMALAAAEAYPAWRMIRRRRLAADAEKAARCFEAIPGPEVDFDTLGRMTGIADPRGRVERIIKDGMLERTELLPEGRGVRLTDRRADEPREAAVKCPACGAPNRVTVGKVGRCRYCGCDIGGNAAV